MRKRRSLIRRCLMLAISAILVGNARLAIGAEPKAAEPAVEAANNLVRSRLPFANRDDYRDAERGFLGTLPDALVTGANGNVVWSQKDYSFLDREDVPATVNPSLWRQAQLNHRHCLFKVMDAIYQVRGFDISNMTLVESNGGLIVIDPLLSVETAKAGLDLYYQYRPRRPVVAVIYTHSHGDHYGGVKGVVSEGDVKAGKVVIIAPEGFLQHAVSESVIAGNAMRRRAQYQFGHLLPKGDRGQVDAGLGKTVAFGTRSLIAPTDVIRKSGEIRLVDGIEILFQMAPESEAPDEIYMYFSQFKVLNMAEVATHNFHNLLAFRGTVVRDTLAWSKYLNEAVGAFGNKTEVLIAQHHWPVFGGERVHDFLSKQRDLYKYVHDQTLRLLNQGLTAAEIAEQLALPESLANEWANRDYYGTVRHNVKAIYQRYLGWYDGNPANLDPLPPIEAAKKYVAYMGGADAVIRRAREDFKNGDYRFVVEVVNKVILSDPTNMKARDLTADAFEQLGYMAESATWRNAYLFAAYELRQGTVSRALGPAIDVQTINAIPTELIFDFLGVRLNGPRANGSRITLNWNFTDTRESYVLTLQNSTLTYTRDTQARDADASLTSLRDNLDAIVLRRSTLAAASNPV